MALNSRFSHTTSEGSGAGPNLRACRFLLSNILCSVTLSLLMLHCVSQDVLMVCLTLNSRHISRCTDDVSHSAIMVCVMLAILCCKDPAQQEPGFDGAGRAEQGRAGLGRAGQGRVGHVRVGQSKAGAQERAWHVVLRAFQHASGHDIVPGVHDKAAVQWASHLKRLSLLCAHLFPAKACCQPCCVGHHACLQLAVSCTRYAWLGLTCMYISGMRCCHEQHVLQADLCISKFSSMPGALATVVCQFYLCI